MKTTVLKYGTGMVILLLLFVLFPNRAFSQANTETVSGTVTNAQTGDPMIGVNILVIGTTTGAATDADGHYSLTVSSLQKTLRFSYIGYKTKMVPINGRTTINVTLQPENLSLEQLVVVGYGTKQKNDVTGAVAVVNPEELQSQPTSSAVKALQGQASGVTIISSGMPGQPPSIRIRGSNTFGDNSPLYVIDGVPTKSISSLNPNIIASMSVLKGAAAASIYGSRASNGVIVVTTKEGQRGDIQVSYNAYGGYSVPPQGNVWNIANAQEQMQIMVNAMKNSGGDWKTAMPQFYDPARPDKPHLPLYIAPTGIFDANDPNVDPTKYYVDPLYTTADALDSFYYIIPASSGTDWFHELFSPGAIMSQNLTVSGGGDIGTYLFSANYFHNAGNIPNQFLKRYSLRVNTNFNIGDRIQIGENLAYHISDNPTVSVHSENGPLGMAMRENPIIPVHDIGGNFAGTIADGLGNGYNPLLQAYNNRNNKAQSNRLFGNVYAQIDFLDNHLSVKTSFGGNYNTGFGHSFNYPDYARSENSATNAYNRYSNDGYNFTWTNTATYRRDFKGGNNIDVLVGMEYHKSKGSGQSASIQDFFSFDPAFVSLSTGSGAKTVGSYHYLSKLFSLFGRINYNYKQRYFASFTIRRDGSSNFLVNRYGVFPAGSIGWRISNESFFNVAWIDNLMLRAGYGIMGNQLNVNPNNPYTLYSNSQASAYYALDGSNSNNTLGFSQSTIGNPLARWEKDKSLNVGVSASMFNGRLSFKASYYQKDIEGLLYNPALPGTAGGAAPPFVNVGSMSNTGVDISVSTLDNITQNLQFNATATFTTYNNEIEKISLISNYFSQAARRFNGSYIVRNAVGHAVSSFFGYKVIGFWNSQDVIDKLNANVQQAMGNKTAEYQDEAAPGFFRFADVNGDGRISPADRTFIGNPNPDFTYGINLGLRYKGFDLGMFWYGSYGNEIWNQTKYYHGFMSHFYGAKSKTLLYDSWTPENHDASLPINTTETNFSNQVPNSFYVEDGSYLRLRNVVLGYTLPVEFLKGTGIQRLRFYVKAANLLTITPYSGVDPAVGYDANTNDPQNGGSSTAFGIDSGTYPTMRKYLFGINLTF